MSRFRFALFVLAILSAGCGEELGPERLPTATVRGTIRVANRPVTGGYILFTPVEGTKGNVRVAPIRLDGSFEADRVPAGRVVVGFDQLPRSSIASPSAPIDLDLIATFRSIIRREIPERPDVRIEIDLFDETLQARRTRRVSPRRRKKAPRKPEPTGGPNPATEPVVRVICRDRSGAVHLDWPADKIKEALADPEVTTWVDVMDAESASNAGVEALLRDVFHFHPLAIEDALQDTHVPKIDDWGPYLYIVVDTIDFEPETDELRLHELDLFLGPNYLVTYHNEPTAVIDRHRRNIEREPENRLKDGAGHMLYRMLDDVVTEFLPAIEHLDDAIDDAQDEVFNHPSPRTLRQIFHIKSCAIRLHRVVIPMREVLNRLARDHYAVVKDEHRVYFRDVYDHLVRIHDIVESLRDLISGALDTYLSVTSNRTNEIMKALTIVNVMFLPMSFVTGFFGMNFFGETLMLTWPPLPKQFLLGLVFAAILGTPLLLWQVARRRGWY